MLFFLAPQYRYFTEPSAIQKSLISCVGLKRHNLSENLRASETATIGKSCTTTAALRACARDARSGSPTTLQGPRRGAGIGHSAVPAGAPASSRPRASAL